MAFYADKDYTTDQTVFEAVNQVMSGNLTLFWYDAKTEKVKGKPTDLRRGLTYKDLDLGSYGYSSIPENLRTSQSMVARGSEKWGNLPDMGYVVNRKSEIWADNVTYLYEEDKSRRWTPAVDVPWSDLDAHPIAAPIEAACSQLYTFLQECALVSMDFAARWVPLVNQDFIEQKSWMCAQMFNWARLNEAFRKRALCGGAGLGRASVSGEQGLKEWLWADSYPKGSLSINLSLGGIVLAICRHVAAFAPSKVDRVLMGYAMQDSARQTAYGSGQLRYYLTHRPAEMSAMQEYVDDSEHVMLALLGSPELIEPLIIISGGGLQKDQVQAGRAAVAKFLRLAISEYFERLEAAGLAASRTRSRIAPVVERISAAA